MSRRYVLLGAGPASMAAAEEIRSADPQAQITVVSAEPEGYYSRPGLAYYLANEEPERRLFPFSSADMEALGIHMIVGHATEVRRGDHTVVLEDGGRLPYDRLLLATGSSAIPIGVPGAELDGVAKLDNLADARDLIRRSRRSRGAVIVGGGITALEIVEGLCARHVKVHYLMRKDRYWSNVLSESESRLVEAGLRQHGVEIHYFAELAQILGKNGKVTGVVTDRGEQIACDLVPIAIGVLPQKQLAEDGGLECARGVLVNEYLASSDPDVFAAGDLAEVVEPRTGARTIEVLWSSATAKGRIAGHNMASDQPTAYFKSVPLNVTRLAGRRITIIGTVGSGTDSDLQGIARGDSETWRRLGESTTVEAERGGDHLRLALQDDVIAGAIVIGDQAISFPLQDLIGARASLNGRGQKLMAPDANVGALIEDAWRDWRTAHV